MKQQIVTINGREYSPLLVNTGECCINCDLGQDQCCTQCHYFEENDSENVALKEIKHKKKPSLLQRIKKLLSPIETPF